MCVADVYSSPCVSEVKTSGHRFLVIDGFAEVKHLSDERLEAVFLSERVVSAGVADG